MAQRARPRMHVGHGFFEDLRQPRAAVVLKVRRVHTAFTEGRRSTGGVAVRRRVPRGGVVRSRGEGVRRGQKRERVKIGRSARFHIGIKTTNAVSWRPVSE